MRSVVSVAILVSTSFLLAGCSGGGEEDDLHYTCPGGMEVHQDDHPGANTTADLAKFCPGGSTSTGSKSNTTASKPNVLPNLVLKITNPDGEETPVTLLDGNLTFDASGSTDSDGKIAGIAVTITDSNTTRTGTLYDAAKQQFNAVTFNFDRAGIVNVTVAMVDDRAGFTVNQTHVYVNTVQNVGSGSINVPMGHMIEGGNDPCEGAPSDVGGGVSGDAAEAAYFAPVSFDVVAGATKIDVTGHADSILTICAPEGDGFAVVSPTFAEGSVSTNPDAVLPTPAGIAGYQVGVYNGGSPGMLTALVVTVHYEPQVAA